MRDLMYGYVRIKTCTYWWYFPQFNRSENSSYLYIIVFSVILCPKRPNFGAFARKNCNEKIESHCSYSYELLLKPNYRDHRPSNLPKKNCKEYEKVLTFISLSLAYSRWFKRHFVDFVFGPSLKKKSKNDFETSHNTPRDNEVKVRMFYFVFFSVFLQ